MIETPILEPMKPKTTPRDFFLYFGSMILLYASAIVFLNLFFSYIDYFFPDALSYYGQSILASIRFPLSAMVVLFPFFIFISSRVSRDIQANPEKRELGVRKWLVFFTLFITAAVIIGDLIFLLYKFLNGETTARFLLKVLSVFAVSAGAFWYFFLESKGQGSRRVYKIFITMAGVAALLSVVGGFIIVGSPSKERAFRFDEERIYDLQNVQSQIISYWQAKKKIPENLEALKDPLSGATIPEDPETREPYAYKPTGALSFSLCGVFNMASREAKEKSYVRSPYGTEENWQHPAGEYCFERTIDPDRYPPLKGVFPTDY